MKIKLLLILLFSVVIHAGAQEDNLKMRLNFENVSGTSVKDAVSGITTKLTSPAKVAAMGKYNILNLGNGSGYLDLTAEAGKLFAACEDHTISVYYRVNEATSLSGAGFFLWTFSTLSANTSTGGAYSAYRLNAQRIASSPGGYSNEKGYSVDAPSATGKWIHVAYTQSGTTGKLYIEGVLKSTISSMPKNSTLYGSTKPAYCWLGRAPFSGDSYLTNTLVYGFSLYDRALTNTEVTTLSAETSELDYAYIHGTSGNNAALLTAIAGAKTLLADAGSYLPGAVDNLKGLVSFAETVAGGQFSQAYMDNILAQLNTTLTSVKATKGITLPTVSDMETAYDINRGFIHPGGMHTQADFDRVKAQLAAKNPTVTAAYNVLKNSAFAQSTVTTGVTETIVRGGGVGENFATAAQAAAKAYQCALRWKIEDNKACAKAAVNILMAWARGHKYFGGDSNYALAAGLQGYQFAQAAELLRDYDGWSAEDFETYKTYTRNVWYEATIGWLRSRSGTWDNVNNPEHFGDRPGHAWSNWGLCNDLAVISIGILLDDVFIYNQGMSFFKYDQVGTFEDPRIKNPLINDGCNEFLGNLVVKVYDNYAPETGAYGQVGQTQESGRDQGHAAMAMGLAADLAHMGYNQGDDLFAYMNHRLAAGFEYIAAYNNAKRDDLPFTQYNWHDVGKAFWGPAKEEQKVMGSGGRGETRAYWGTVIGMYEGVKGVEMPFSKIAYQNMVDNNVEAVYTGGASWGFDHLRFSVLMNTYDGLAPADKVPTELTPKMEYQGEVIHHNELGGLKNTYVVNNNTSLPKGKTVKLMPQLPKDEEDTGQWLWDTGETTRDITVTTDFSQMYRVTYTNKNGIKSQQCFALAVTDDCIADNLVASVTYNGKTSSTDMVSVLYGQTVTLNAKPNVGWGTHLWTTGQTTSSITTSPVTASREYTAYYTNQGGKVSACTFHVNVVAAEPYIMVGTSLSSALTTITDAGSQVTLGLNIPITAATDDVTWQDGSHGAAFTLNDIQATDTYTAEFKMNGQTYTYTFTVYVKDAKTSRLIEPGNYMIRHIATDTYLTAHDKNELATFEAGNVDTPSPSQVWFIDRKTTAKYNFTSLADSLILTTTAKMSTFASYPFSLQGAQGSEFYAIYTSTSGNKYWDTDNEGNILTSASTSLTGFQFELIPVEYDPVGINGIPDNEDVAQSEYYTPNGIRLNAPQEGVTIVRQQMENGSVKTIKILK